MLLVAALALGVAGGDTRAAEVRGTVLAAPLTVELEVARTNVRLGERVLVSASVRNLSAVPISGISLRLRSDPASLVVLGPAARALGTLAAGDVGSRNWVMCAAASGNVLVLAMAEWRTPAGVTMRSESVAELIEVRTEGRSNCPR
jgi:hypothetical protein